MNTAEFPCSECGHSNRMHVKGASPRYAGCMVRVERGVKVKPCWCALPPDQVIEAVDTIHGQLADGTRVRLEPVR
jgi:hypothetical protein